MKQAVLLIMLTAVVAHSQPATAQQPEPAAITGISSGGVGFVSYSTSPTGVSASVGRWDTPYPHPDTGSPAPGLEPQGNSDLYIDINVGTGGFASFSYRLYTYDAGIWDWLDVYLETPTGARALVNHLGKPGSEYGAFWSSTNISQSVDLNSWRNQRIRFVMRVRQDGWGDQTKADLVSFGIRTCNIPPLTPLTDPDAIAFENGQRWITSGLTAETLAALKGFQARITALHGSYTPNSAYRPPEYQLHLRDVYGRWDDLRGRREPECETLRTEVQNEFRDHGLSIGARPAGPSGPHVRGTAFDMTVSLPQGQDVDTIAREFRLYRTMLNAPTPETWHFEYR